MLRKVRGKKNGRLFWMDLETVFKHEEWAETVSKLEVFLKQNQDVVKKVSNETNVSKTSE